MVIDRLMLSFGYEPHGDYGPRPDAVRLTFLGRIIDGVLEAVWRVSRALGGRCRGRFAVTTRFLPPLWSGQAVVLGRLLAGLDPTRYCLITRAHGSDRRAFQETLPAPYFDLPVERRLTNRRMRPLVERLNFLLAVLQRGLHTARVLQREKLSTLVVCTGDLVDPPAAWLAARLTGCDLYMYFFDDFTLQWWAEERTVRAAGWLERLICRRATGLIAPNEVMAKVLRGRYGRDTWIVRNPAPLNPPVPACLAFPIRPGEIQVTFTGAIYHLNYDVLRAIKQAAAVLNREGTLPRVRLHIYTAQPHEALEAEGLNGPDVALHQHVPPEQVQEIQRTSDILLIPFSFTPAAQSFVKSSATAKLADYLVTGRPILALCPRDSFLAIYLETHGCGIVVDNENPEKLAAAIRRIADDHELRYSLAEKALACARQDFNPAAAQHDLLVALNQAS
jgi:glycosyltransferase involved in cell wall biosynthesis